jgi:hypothetical protein
MANTSRNDNTFYRDYACVTEIEVRNEPDALKDIFPVKLHYMLSEMEKDGLENIISWQPHGRCFIIHDPNALQERCLPL